MDPTSPNGSPPTVFISYSHDSPEHKRWVLDFATELRRNGIDVIIDAWDLRAGDDVPKFMERGVRDSNRVLMICTERYVAKANEGVGGVGYEAMIVTGELVRDLGTAKFIPVIRQDAATSQVPTSVSTRKYIDLRDSANRETGIAELVRELHDIPPAKPPLGASPFSSPAVERASDNERHEDKETPGDSADPSEIFDRALSIARDVNILEWRKLVRRSRELIDPALRLWSAKYSSQVPRERETLINESMEGAEAFSPLTAVALGGVASGSPKFRDQIGLLEDILNPNEWQRSGFTVRAALPDTGAFVYQALYGAMCMNVGDIASAMRLARAETFSPSYGQMRPLWSRHDVVGWPEALGKNALQTWEAALGLADRWNWVAHVFGAVGDYQAAIYAYYVSLNALEFIEYLRAGHEVPDPSVGALRLDVPPAFENTPDEVKRRGYRLITAMGSELKEFWLSMGVAETKIRDQWPRWIEQVRYWNRSAGSIRALFGGKVAHERLVLDVLG